MSQKERLGGLIERFSFVTFFHCVRLSFTYHQSWSFLFSLFLLYILLISPSQWSLWHLDIGVAPWSRDDIVSSRVIFSIERFGLDFFLLYLLWLCFSFPPGRFLSSLFHSFSGGHYLSRCCVLSIKLCNGQCQRVLDLSWYTIVKTCRWGLKALGTRSNTLVTESLVAVFIVDWIICTW